MMNESYNILSIFVTSGLFLACGLMLLFTAIPDSPLSGYYRKARYAMACAYLFFVVVEVVKFLFGDLSGHGVSLLQTVTLTIAASQAFLFSFAMLALVEVRFPGWRYMSREAAPVLLFIAAVFTVHAFCPGACFRAAFYGFAGMYALLLAHYTFLFVTTYRRFRRRMDNYYSGGEARRSRWVVFSFFAALSIGVTALLTSVFMSTLVALLFTVVFDVFYTFFAIRFINYAYRFPAIERAMEVDAPEEAGLPGDRKAPLSAPVLHVIDTGLKNWMDEKLFLQPGVTIADVSRYTGTNNKYLSLYINQHAGKTFRTWINDLRVEEAKRLLLEYPDMGVADVATHVGFVTKSHFGQQFHALTGCSPSGWRQGKR